jgi:hypothetical protein
MEKRRKKRSKLGKGTSLQVNQSRHAAIKARHPRVTVRHSRSRAHCSIEGSKPRFAPHGTLSWDVKCALGGCLHRRPW